MGLSSAAFLQQRGLKTTVTHQAPPLKARRPAAARRPSALPENAEPPWMLPLMRLLRSDAHMPAEEACRRLSATLPPTVTPPTPQEVLNALRRLGNATR